MFAHTKHTIVDAAALRAEIERIRSAGYAIVEQELELGFRSVAVPVVRISTASTSEKTAVAAPMVTASIPMAVMATPGRR